MPEYKGQTDQVLNIKLQSYILNCFWGLSEAAMGGQAPIEVRTAYVADGSKIEITIKAKVAVDGGYTIESKHEYATKGKLITDDPITGGEKESDVADTQYFECKLKK